MEVDVTEKPMEACDVRCDDLVSDCQARRRGIDWLCLDPFSTEAREWKDEENTSKLDSLVDPDTSYILRCYSTFFLPTT
jgi:hypothetical protein